MTWLARLKKQKGPDTHPTKPPEPGFVGFVGTPGGHIQKITGSTTPANDPEPDPDRWAWPHSTAMNGAEIDTFTARLMQFTDRGLILDDAEQLADKMVTRDRESDDRRVCLECAHLTGYGAGPWACRGWQRAGIAIRSRDAQLPRDLVKILQRCDGFEGGTI
ncbi:MAG: hypothetical protein H7245_08570 [Candidatus Saccharibacteria bacterium]|nr:hypothetical protein [Pseudorhodobacter sp.]